MQDLSEGKIFVAAERGHTETDWFRSYFTFNFGPYQHQSRNPFGPLYVLNEDTLSAGRKMNFLIEEATLLVLLPVVGAVAYINNKGNDGVLQAGEAVIFHLAANDTIDFSNPFEEGLVNYLHIWFKQPVNTISVPQKVTFDIDTDKNKLLPIFDATADRTNGIKYCIGKFGGREEIIYQLQQPGNGVFVFVLQGAFEVQYRLLEARDGLALWNTNEVEIEALSNEAIILLIELPMVNG